MLNTQKNKNDFRKKSHVYRIFVSEKNMGKKRHKTKKNTLCFLIKKMQKLFFAPKNFVLIYLLFSLHNTCATATGFALTGVIAGVASTGTWLYNYIPPILPTFTPCDSASSRYTQHDLSLMEKGKPCWEINGEDYVIYGANELDNPEEISESDDPEIIGTNDNLEAIAEWENPDSLPSDSHLRKKRSDFDYRGYPLADSLPQSIIDKAIKAIESEAILELSEEISEIKNKVIEENSILCSDNKNEINQMNTQLKYLLHSLMKKARGLIDAGLVDTNGLESAMGKLHETLLEITGTICERSGIIITGELRKVSYSITEAVKRKNKKEVTETVTSLFANIFLALKNRTDDLEEQSRNYDHVIKHVNNEAQEMIRIKSEEIHKRINDLPEYLLKDRFFKKMGLKGKRKIIDSQFHECLKKIKEIRNAIEQMSDVKGTRKIVRAMKALIKKEKQSVEALPYTLFLSSMMIEY